MTRGVVWVTVGSVWMTLMPCLSLTHCLPAEAELDE